MSAFRRFLVAAVMAAVSWHGASAHAVLLDADPPDGAILEAVPSQVTLHFNEPVKPIRIRVLGPNGRPLGLPEAPRAVDRDVRLTLPATDEKGGYLVSYRVISLDTHPVGGSLTFVVGTGPSATPLPGNDRAAERWETAFPFVHGVMLLAMCVALGGALFCAFVVPKSAKSVVDRARPYGFGAAAVGALAAVLAVGVRGAGLAASPLSEFLTATPWRVGFSTALCPSTALILAGLALGTLAFSIKRHASRAFSLGGVLLGAIGLGLTSHAALAPPATVAFPAFVLHASLAAFWFGSLPLLCVVLAAAPSKLAGEAVARFSAIALWGVAILLMAGVALIVVQTGPDLGVWVGPAWTDSAYGPVLAAKFITVACVMALAVHHRRHLASRLRAGESGAPGTFIRSIRREGALMVVVLALAASLGSLEPPRSVGALASVHDHTASGAALYVVSQGYGILLEMTPAAPGPNEITLRFRDIGKGGVRVTPREVTVGLALPSAGIEPIRRRAKPVEDGGWRVELMPVPVSGLWQVQVDALITGFDKLVTTIDMPIVTPKR